MQFLFEQHEKGKKSENSTIYNKTTEKIYGENVNNYIKRENLIDTTEQIQKETKEPYASTFLEILSDTDKYNTVNDEVKNTHKTNSDEISQHYSHQSNLGQRDSEQLEVKFKKPSACSIQAINHIKTGEPNADAVDYKYTFKNNIINSKSYYNDYLSNENHNKLRLSGNDNLNLKFNRKDLNL